MKTKIFISSFALLFIASVAFAQKAELQSAINYLRYDQLDKAKDAIDEAVVNESTMNMDKAWYYRGAIYESISSSDKYKSLAPNALEVAYQSYKKALEIDPNSDFKDQINARMLYIKTTFFNLAVDAFKAKDYNTSLTDFENVLKITPDDSTANLYAAYSAEKAGNIATAEEHYRTAIDKKQDNPTTYRSLANLYKSEKDTARALSVIQEGRKKYPGDLELMLSEINIYLPQGKSKEAIDLMNEAIAKDTTNASLYFALGATYDNLANSKGASSISPEDKASYLDKAKKNYLEAIAKKPDYFEANYNLGALYFNQAAEMLTKIDGIKDPNVYAKAKEDVEVVFAQSQPYLEKALQEHPDDHDTLLSLKQLYFRENQMDKYYKVKDKLDAQSK